MNAPPANAPLLEADDVTVRFPVAGGFRRRSVQAVNGVSLRLAAGETLGLVGESGSGKSTLGRALLGLEAVSGGRIAFDGGDVSAARGPEALRLRRETAAVFQDPYGSLNPRLTVGETIAEVLRVHRKAPPAGTRARVAELLRLVGLGPEMAERKPRQLSGGQCQRVGIARALAVEPRLIVADECVAALDVSIQGQIVNLFMDLTERMDLALIFIAHDLGVVRRLCRRVAVMYGGRIVEEGAAEDVFERPRHPYTAALIRAIPAIDPDRRLPAEPLPGEPPSPLKLPEGCAFHPRCAHARAVCRAGPPPILRREAGHAWACVLPPGTLQAQPQTGPQASPQTGNTRP